MATFAQKYSSKFVPRFRPAPKPDYSNQLDLFSNLGSDSADDTAPVTDTPAVERPSSSDGARPGGQLGLHLVADGGVDNGPDPRPDVPAQAVVSESVGNSDDGISLPTDRGPPVVIDIEEPATPSRDFRITEAHRIGAGSLHVKARENIAAIRTLKQIETENRDATDDEKAILARYVGWGAMASVFEPEWRVRDEWKREATNLRQLLTDDEHAAARASTPNAHFTSPLVISAMWQAMERMGLKHGTILEPSMGVGHFLGLMPDSIEAKRTGVELDSITASIAQKLYPDSTIFHKSFEETPLPDNYFDTVIGNIPFGNYAVHDPAYKPALTRAIHDYFFAKSLDKLRPGGVMALITSRYTMDKQDGTIRRYLGERANLIAAIRLPNTAFKANAGTEVTTDILFLQKHGPGIQPAKADWLNLAPVSTDDGLIEVNEYFARHPDMMLGKLALEGTMYRGAEPTLVGELTPEILDQAISRLPAGIMSPAKRTRQLIEAPTDVSGVKDGAYAERDGHIYIRNGASFEDAKLASSAASRVRAMMRLRDSVRLVFRTQLEDAPEETVTSARKVLNEVYDTFVSRYGPVSSRENMRAYAGDPDQPLLLSLENYDPETKKALKTAVFTKRTLERYRPVDRVETAAEALTVSLNETGGIDWPRMQQLTGRTENQLQRELGSLVYRNPEGDWETADRYLSGDVRAKLRAAESASSLDPLYSRNIEALKAVQPTDLEPGDIEARLGASWIPASDVKDFVVDLLGTTPRFVNVAHAPAIATWTVEIDSYAKHEVANTTTHGTARFKASDLIEQALNARTPTAYDELEDGTRVINQQETLAAREKQQQLKDAFREWVWKDPARTERLARVYNDTFNNLRLREFDGSHLTFPGMNRDWLREGDLDQHQKNAVWRIMQSGSTLLGHCVGAGKTAEISAACMELRRLGLAKKPMIVVPNHLVEQWGSEFLRLYPNAHIFIAGKESFAAGNRQKAMARIATGNYDAVIVSHRSFEKLPVSDELFERFTQSEVDKLEEAILEAKAEKGDNKRIVKELEKAKKRFVAKLKDRADRENKDDGITFEEMGVDQIFVDESDTYKNLYMLSKMSRIAGLPNTDSNRASDMFLKSRYIRERNSGRGVVFATGTPISNTMAEMYTLLRYLAPELLQERGVEHFDAWAANFGEAVTALELAPDGSGYRMHTRFAKFINLPELLTMFRTFADVQTADMLKLPRPALAGGKPHAISAPASEDLKEFVQTLVKRSEALRRDRIDPRVDNMLKITSEGRKAALDMRLVNPFADVCGDTKLSRAITRIYDIWEKTKAKRSTQLVFCDLSTPSDKFNVYDEVRSKLIELGVAESEIAFIHDAETDAQKKLLFDSVNAGRIRIVIGSTRRWAPGPTCRRNSSPSIT